MVELGPLTGVVARTEGRVRLQRALEGATAAAALVFALGMGVRIVQRLFFFRTQNEPAWLAVLVALGALVAWLWPVRRESIAARIDRAHALHDRVRTALDFAARKERTEFMEAAIRDAVSRAASLSPQRAVPWRVPRARYAALGLLVAWTLAGWLPARTAVQPIVTKPVARAVALTQDELQGFREELAALERAGALSPEAARDLAAYRALLDRVARGELDRSEAIEALLSLEKRLLTKSDDQNAADRTAFDELAKDLAKTDEALSRALTAQDPAAAAAALEALAKKLSTLPPSERARLKEGLDRVKRRQEAREAARKREAELDGLLKKREQEKASPAEKRLLERDRRELERLRRENEAERTKSRELERLQRDLADASQALGQNALDQAQRSMQQGAEDLKREAQDQGTREQQEAMAKQVSQLRELLQRQREQEGKSSQPQNADGKPREQRTQRFVMRAAGQDPDAKQAELVVRKPGEEGQGGDSQKKPGGGDGTPELELGGDQPAGAEIEIPGMGAGLVTDTRPTASDEHDTRTLRNATDIESELRDSQVTGTAGKGPTRSEVILDAADRGFATASYRKVYSDYRSHAEEALEKENIPGGYRFYVRRYFQLIRPREERNAP